MSHKNFKLAYFRQNNLETKDIKQVETSLTISDFIKVIQSMDKMQTDRIYDFGASPIFYLFLFVYEKLIITILFVVI